MQEAEIRRLFREAFDGKGNFMTPYFVRYGSHGDYAYEISKGRGFNHEEIFGVTVLKREGTSARLTDLSKGVFKTLEDAEWYIENVVKA